MDKDNYTIPEIVDIVANRIIKRRGTSQKYGGLGGWVIGGVNFVGEGINDTKTYAVEKVKDAFGFLWNTVSPAAKEAAQNTAALATDIGTDVSASMLKQLPGGEILARVPKVTGWALKKVIANPMASLGALVAAGALHGMLSGKPLEYISSKILPKLMHDSLVDRGYFVRGNPWSEYGAVVTDLQNMGAAATNFITMPAVPWYGAKALYRASKGTSLLARDIIFGSPKYETVKAPVQSSTQRSSRRKIPLKSSTRRALPRSLISSIHKASLASSLPRMIPDQPVFTLKKANTRAKRSRRRAR